MPDCTTVRKKEFTLVTAQVHKKLRAMHYELAVKTPELKRYIADRALAIDMYPASLRIDDEEQNNFNVRNLLKSGMKEKHMRTEERSLTINEVF